MGDANVRRPVATRFEHGVDFGPPGVPGHACRGAITLRIGGILLSNRFAA